MQKESLHIIIGITEDGYKDIIVYRISFHESDSSYTDMLRDLYEWGLEHVLLILSDSYLELKMPAYECIQIQIIRPYGSMYSAAFPNWQDQGTEKRL